MRVSSTKCHSNILEQKKLKKIDRILIKGDNLSCLFISTLLQRDINIKIS